MLLFLSIFFFIIINISIGHDNNWAIVVGTSRYWHNYRHLNNALAVYDLLKQQGFHDDRIIFMNANDIGCDSRNPYPSDFVVPELHHHYHNNNNINSHNATMYTLDIEIDYRGLDVNVESFKRLMIGSHETPLLPLSKRLNSNKNSNVFLYMTGHGGDEFLKFHDLEEINADEIADMVNIMNLRKRYKNLFVIIDTCQAVTMFSKVTAPNVAILASSRAGENSYAYRVNTTVAVPTIDRFTLQLYDFFRFYKSKGQSMQGLTIKHLLNSLDERLLGSKPVLSGPWSSTQIKLQDFFSPHSRISKYQRITL